MFVKRHFCGMIFLFAILAANCFSVENLQWETAKWPGKSEHKKLADGTLEIKRSDAKTSGAWQSQKIKVSPGERFKLSAEIASDLSAGRAEIIVDFLDKAGRRVSLSHSLRLRGKNEFTKKSSVIKIPDGIAQIRLLAVSQLSSGTVKFRKISLVPATEKQNSAIQKKLSWVPAPWPGKNEYKKLDDGTLEIKRSDTEHSGAWFSNQIPAKRGDTFVFATDITANLNGGRAEVSFEMLNKKNRRIKIERIISVNGKKFSKHKKTTVIVTEPETVAVRFLLIAQHASGTIQFKNMEYQRKPADKQLTLTKNDISWSPSNWPGENSYRIDGDTLVIIRKNDDKKTAGAWQSNIIKTREGNQYVFYADAVSKNASGYIIVGAKFYNASGRTLSSPIFFRIGNRKNDEFMSEKMKFTAPEDAVSMQFFLSLQKGGGEAYFRNAYIKPIEKKLIFEEGFTIMDDLSTRISWRSSAPVFEKAKVFFSADKTRTCITESEVGAECHSVILPANIFPQGKKVTAEITYSDEGNKASATVTFISGAAKRIAKSKPFSINLSVTEPTASARKAWPVAGGIPFSKGILRDTSDVMLTDANGRKVPAEFTVISRWGDGSVQFLGYTFETATNKTKPVVYTLTDSDGKTGAVAKVKSKLLDTITGKIVTADGKVMLCNPRDGKKTVTRSTACTTTEVTGKFSGDAGFGYRLFIRDYPSGISTVQYSIYGGKEDTLIRNIQWELPALNEPEFSNQSKPGKVFSTLQRDEKNGTGDGFVRDRKANVSIGMRHYREKWPKGMANDDKTLALQLLPPLPADYADSKTLKPLDILIKYYWLKDGNYIYRRHLELTGSFTVAPADAKPEWFKEKLIAAASPEYYCATGVFGNIAPRKAGEFDYHEKLMETGFDKFISDRKKVGQYGWMNYGDWYGERYTNWGNNEYDLAFTMALFYARTADQRYLRRGMEMADHHQAVDRFVSDDPMDKRTRYKHSAGHTGNFFTVADPRFKGFNLKTVHANPGFDYEGGHNFEHGSMLISALEGDKYIFNKALASIEQLARTQTPNMIIGIERSPGWLLENLNAGYFLTGDRYFRLAGEICVDAVFAQQDPKGGSLNLRQDLSECNCYDKVSHRGGKPFAAGVLMHSLVRFYNMTGNEKAKLATIGLSRWLLEDAWDKNRYLFRYKTGCDHFKHGSKFYPLILDSMIIAGRWTNEPRYKNIVLEHFGRNFPQVSSGGGSQGVGKIFSMSYRSVPHIFKLLKEDGITELKINALPNAPVNCVIPDNAIKMEAENFISQSGGKVIIREDKIGVEKCFSHWDGKGHTIIWKMKNPAGKYKIAMHYCGINPGYRKITAGKNISATAKITPTSGYGELPSDWLSAILKDDNGKDIVFDLPDDAALAFENISGGGMNVDCLWLLPVK